MLRNAARSAFVAASRLGARPTAAATVRTARPQIFAQGAAAPAGIRFKTGPAASPTTIPDDLLEKLGKLSTQALIDGLWVMGWPTSFIEGARYGPSHGVEPPSLCS
jgi:hypothetical protein